MNPPSDVLKALASGRLPVAEAERVGGWLDRNPQVVALDDLGRDDPFVNMLSRVPAGWRPDPAADRLAHRLAENLPDLTTDWRDPSLPEFVGKWRVLRKLGEGGMGVVYLAEDDALKRQVAVKVLNDRFAGTADARTRFLREARAAAGIDSPNVVRVHHVHDDPPAIVMEYVPGVPLEEWAEARTGKVTAAEVVWVARELLTGLAAAHAKGIVHRDVKPHNAIVAGGRIKLLDFGLARTPTAVDGITVLGGVVGTPAYMSPEQAKGQAPDPRADVFAVGVTLYRLVTGRSPYHMGISVITENGKTIHPPSLKLPAGLSGFVARLMSRNPADRPKDAAEALELLAKIDRRPAWPRVAVAAGVVLAAAAVVAGIVITIRDENDKILVTITVPEGVKVRAAQTPNVPDAKSGKSITAPDPPPPPPPPPERQVTVIHGAILYEHSTGGTTWFGQTSIGAGAKVKLIEDRKDQEFCRIRLESGETVWILRSCLDLK